MSSKSFLILAVVAVALWWYLNQEPPAAEAPPHAKDFTGPSPGKSTSETEVAIGDAAGGALKSGCEAVGLGGVSGACAAVGKWGGGRAAQAVKELVTGTSGHMKLYVDQTDADFITEAMCQCYHGNSDSCAIVHACVPSIRTCHPGDCDCNPKFQKGGPGGEIPLLVYKDSFGGPYEAVIENGKFLLPWAYNDSAHKALSISQTDDVYKRYVAAGGGVPEEWKTLRARPLANQTNTAPPLNQASAQSWRGTSSSAVGSFRR